MSPSHTILAVALAALSACSESAAGAPTTGSTITGVVAVFDEKTKLPISEVYVYLEQIFPKHHKKPTTLPGATWPAQKMNQIARDNGRKAFDPHVLVIPVGTTVWFPNLDSERHNVFSPTDPPGFDLGIYLKDTVGHKHVFMDANELGVAAEIYCDVHAEMDARIKVVDSAWIAQVGANGTFKLANVPAGRYKVVAWMPDSSEVKSDELDVDGLHDQAVTGDLDIQKGPPPKSHPRKNGAPYNPQTYSHP